MNVAAELLAFLAPLRAALSDPRATGRLVAELGLVTNPPLDLRVPEPIAELASATEAATTRLVDLTEAADSGELSAADAAAAVTTVLDVLGAVAAVRDAVVDGTTDVSLVFTDPSLLAGIAERLPSWLLVTWLHRRHPLPGALLDALGALVPTDGGGTRLDLGAVADLLTAPQEKLPEILELRADALVRLAGALAASLGAADQADDDVRVGIGIVTRDDQVEQHDPPITRTAIAGPSGLATLDVSAESTREPVVFVRIAGLPTLGSLLEIAPGWTLGVSTDATDPASLTSFAITAAGPAADPDADPATAADEASLIFTGAPPEPWLLIGTADATRLELAGLDVALDLAALTGAPEASLRFSTQALRLVVATGDAGGFLGALLGGDVEVDIGLDAELSGDGLAISGGAGFAVSIVVERSIGIVTVHHIDLALGGIADGVELTAAAVLTAALGPFAVTVDGIGLAVSAISAAVGGEGGGVLGDLDVRLAFLPPAGLGIAIDAGVVSGGGYVIVDPDGGGFAGVAELHVLAVGISAVVIVDTDLPDDAWSLFLALFLDLPSIQLGFGFTMTGAGGVAGVNRTLDTTALVSAVRSGSLDDLLFPADPVANAPTVIAAFDSLFPSAPGRYTFGPVVRIGWGTPTLVEAQLGIVISLPDPVTIVLLGSVSAALPTEELGLVVLHLDVAGVADFGQGTISIDSSLHDSWVVGFALSGDMALRATFGGGRPSFLMSLGGFHPGFEPVELDAFPPMRRLALGLSAGSFLDLHLECYFALTSNSVQFGSAFSLRADIAGFGIDGGTEFDAVVQFSPFLVVTRLGFHVAITAAGVDLAGVWLDASVEGPNPWYLVGTARFKILGFEEELRIDERIGAPAPEPEVEEADPLALLRAAVGQADAWSAVATLSPGVVLAGTTGVADGADELVAQPDGIVTVSQRAVPLGVGLDKVGDAPPGPYDLFTLAAGIHSLPSTGEVRDWFSPGYFFVLGTGEQLSAPSFELLSSGLSFGGGDPVGGRAVVCTQNVEQILRDPELDEEHVGLGTLALAADLRVAIVTAGSSHALARTGFAIAADDDPVSLDGTAWSVTHRLTGEVLASAGTWSAAHQSEAGRRAAGTVVPSWEASS